MQRIKNIPKLFLSFIETTKAYTIFLVLLLLVGVKSIIRLLAKFKIPVDPITNWFSKLMLKIDGKRDGDVARVYLIELALRNLKAKRTRAIVTIGGVAVGVSAIVFLVSLGYGLERLVISRVARLDELKMIDIGVGVATQVKMDDEMINKIKEIKGVSEVIPVVSTVSKINFNNSITDLMALGVDERYLKALGVKIVAGEEFKNKNSTSLKIEGTEGQVAGAEIETVETKEGEKVSSGVVRLNILPEERVAIRKDCNMESDLLGFGVRIEGGLIGEEVWGEKYFIKGSNKTIIDVNGREMSKWIRVKAPLWNKNGDDFYPIVEDNIQKWAIGCVKATEVKLIAEDLSQYQSLDDYLNGEAELMGEVLGETTEASAAAEATPAAELFETVVATDSSGVEWIELKKTDVALEDKKIEYQQNPVAEAFISSGMLQLWGLTKDKAVGQVFKVTQIIPDGLIPGISGKIMSEEKDYKVTGVVDDDTSSYFYYQINDARLLGVKNYSQLKLLADNKIEVPEIRKQIETMGLRTSSTLDTVAQIEKLFGTIRLLLGFLGMIALAVAALGMFNTMTVSLLERTREVGVMKAMGMLSDDVKELFLAESMIMGVGGGLFGVLLGWLFGAILSLVLTSISVVKGQGMISVSYVPWFLVVFIMLVSVIVGMLTGWYPSKRARSISALNALRYE
ncbi:MAG TPA: ABC transporter permease [Candidatus Woesebacteria bacterium]|nr:ABC transporter permease [Candidatus Woesebacteria bacterium]